MEQIGNFGAATAGEEAGRSQAVSWRSLGGIAAALVARAAAERAEDVQEEVDRPFVPVAWAAE